MGKNDFRVDTTSSEKKTFFKKKQTLLGLAFLLTVPQMFSAVILPIQWLLGARRGVVLNVTSIASQELYFLVMTIAGISVLKMIKLFLKRWFNALVSKAILLRLHL